MLNRYPPEEIVPALTHHNGRVRHYAAMMLGIDGNDQLVNFLINFLIDLLQSESARWAAARALGVSIRPLPDPGRPAVPGPAAVDRLAVESLTAALRDPDALVRVHAADALRAFSAPASLPALLPMLQNPEEEVRFAAALAANDLGAAQSLPVLLESLRRSPPYRDGRRPPACVCWEMPRPYPPSWTLWPIPAERCGSGPPLPWAAWETRGRPRPDRRSGDAEHHGQRSQGTAGGPGQRTGPPRKTAGRSGVDPGAG